MIEAGPQEESIPFNPFTTLVKVTNEDNLPVTNTELSISTDTRTAVYISEVYYVMGKIPIKILTDTTSSLTIIETTNDIHCAIIRVSGENTDQVMVVNPMRNGFDRLQEFETEESLKNIQIPKKFVAGGFWDSDKTESLIIDESRKVVREVAENMANLRKAYFDALNANPQLSSTVLKTSDEYFSLVSWLKHAAGDVLQAAKSILQKTKDGVLSAMHVIKDEATNVWNFTVNVSQKAWSGILITSKATASVVMIAWHKLEKGIQTV